MRRPFVQLLALVSFVGPVASIRPLAPIGLLASVVFLAILLAVPPSFAQTRVERRRGSRVAGESLRADGGINVLYKGVELSHVIRQIGHATGTRFIFGDDVRGVIHITVPRRVTKAEALELLRAALFIRGFAQLPAGEDAYKVVPIAATPSDSALVLGAMQQGSERAITTLVTLVHTDANVIAENVKSLVPSSGAVVAYPPTNSLILSGTESALGRLIEIVRVLDEAAAIELMTQMIRYRDVGGMIELAESVLNEGRPRSDLIEFFSDERMNMLIARASSERLDELRDFIETFDRHDLGAGRIHVIRVLNRDSEEIAEMLLALKSGTEVLGQGAAVVQRRDAGRRAVRNVESLAGKDFSLTTDVATRSIIVQAEPSVAKVVAQVIKRLDRIPPRVSVEIFYYEVQRPSGYLLSFDFTTLIAPKGSDDLAFTIRHTPSGSGVPTSPEGGGAFGRFARDPIVVDITDPTTGISIPISLPTNEAAIEASANQVRADLLNRPHIVVTSGEEHEIFIGNNVPIPVSPGVTTGLGGDVDDAAQATADPFSRQQDIERVDVGTRLRVKPIVSEAGQIQLDLTFEFSQVTNTLTGNSAAEGVTLVQRTVDTTAILRPGEYVIIGMQDESSTAYGKTGIPWLMNLPGIGLFFSRTEERVVDTQIVIAAKARLLRSPADDVAETIRRRLAMERSNSRVNDLERLSETPWAVRLATFEYKQQAHEVADAFESDGFVTRATRWEGSDRAYWDVYLIGYASFEDASTVGLQVLAADWEGEVLLVPDINDLGPDD